MVVTLGLASVETMVGKDKCINTVLTFAKDVNLMV